MKIEKYLVLNKYLLSLFGITDFKDLQEKLKDVNTGCDEEGRSYFVHVLCSLEGLNRDKIPPETLLRYDENIQSQVRKINYRREPVSLKYFQYLAVLFTEIVLDNLKNKEIEFCGELNTFLKTKDKEQEIKLIDDFTKKDLKKLAFWMATGAGKTLLLHLNYHQFFHYKLFSPDSIILITPNEALSKQHFKELQKSGIPCRLYQGKTFSSPSAGGVGREILVLEMTKLVEEKRGGGVTLPIEVFEGRNLIFVDEGHKGKKSEEQKWARLRDKLAENGFVFEYSATFGQILSENNQQTLKEYSKSIILDYSYKYFYLDGYGKDFTVLNVQSTKVSAQEFQETMFVANLLSFYEQLLVYEENKNLAREYNLEKPLWIFVGTTVTGKEEESDVVRIVEFMARVMQDEPWMQDRINHILKGGTGLVDEADKDIFTEKFTYLRRREFDFNDLYRKVFGGRGNFALYELKNAEGELGLRVGEAAYFGVVNIGDVAGFKKELEKKGMTVNQDVVGDSLFESIKKEDSSVNVLIGSKKFIEGWDTWRVSSLGLLNMGKGQGPQIIQLFGRGIRLKGKGMSLKRSGEKASVQYLEMLNIYSIKADYLSRFLEAIRKEEVEFETIEIPVKQQHKEKWPALYTLAKDENKRFEEEEVLRLRIDPSLTFTLDLLPRVTMYLAEERAKNGIGLKIVAAETQEMQLSEDILELLDWNRIEQEIYNFKMVKSYWNLVLSQDKLKNVLLTDKYKILALAEMLEVKNENDRRRVEDIAILGLKKYLELFYKRYARRFETENIRYDKVTGQLFFAFEKPDGHSGYTVQIKKKEKELIKEVKKLAEDLDKLYQEDDAGNLPRLYFDQHLYLPVLLQSEKIDKISPAGLVGSEKKFLLGLRQYLKENPAKFSGVEVYLLRNFPKTGIGFFDLSSFYPDFIMWVKKEKKQTVVFIDPKGLEHAKGGLNNEKIRLKEEIKSIEQRLEHSLSRKDVALESFILSQTPYEELTRGNTKPEPKEEYLNQHVLFLDESTWAERLFAKIIGAAKR